MTRFQASGPRIRYTPVETEKPFKQLVGLYGMWNSLGPETKLRIKKALGVNLNAEDELALHRLDAQRARLQDYMNNGGQAEKFNKTIGSAMAEQQAIQNPVQADLAAAQQTALNTPYTWTSVVPAAYTPTDWVNGPADTWELR